MSNYKEKKKNLFKCPTSASLAHCVSADFNMGRGIAVEFKKCFGMVEKLKSLNKKPGECAIIHDIKRKRYIYYLITKDLYWIKPTYNALHSCLKKMKKHCEKKSIRKLCMPHIGCGLDKLNWSIVKDMIKDVFKNSNIKVRIYYLRSDLKSKIK